MNIFDAVQAFAGALRGDIADTNSNLLTSFSPSATATNTPADAATAGAAIRAAVSGGYTLQTFTSSDAVWTVPPDLAAATEAYAGASNGGGKGNPGAASNLNNSSCLGGDGGKDGGYQLEKIDPSALGATLNVTVGAAASTNGADGGVTSIVDGATTLVTATSGVGSIATPQGYVPANSKPGSGGAGGNAGIGSAAAAVSDGVDGESSATALGGAGGVAVSTTSSGTGNAGGAGNTGQTSTLPICGGSGGGGGGSQSKTNIGGSATGGAGGSGGFPGGASGGGGAAQGNSGTTVTGGAAGTPANGFAFLFWR